jgi:hypothetical protein
MMDERSLVLLRRKLEALNYTERLDAASAPLVVKLVEDLVRTTDSYRSVKLQSAKYAQEISAFNTKVSGTVPCCADCAAACTYLNSSGDERHSLCQTLRSSHTRLTRPDAANSWCTHSNPRPRPRGPPCVTAPAPAQLEIVKQDCTRLANENSALHSQLIQAGEQAEALRVRSRRQVSPPAPRSGKAARPHGSSALQRSGKQLRGGCESCRLLMHS